MIILLTMNITANIAVVVINYLFGFGNDFFAVHTIVIICPIVDVRISVTYSCTYTVGAKNLYTSDVWTVSYILFVYYTICV